MADPLEDTRAKLERARIHFASLRRQASQLGRDRNRHRVLGDYDEDEGRYVVYSKMSPEPLPNLSLPLGDLIHCARGALDYVAWQLALKHRRGKEPSEQEAKSIQFPITSRIDLFNRARLWPFVSQDVRREMLRHQPHPGSDPENCHLSVLQWVSNRDKHRLIVSLFADISPPLLPEYVFDPPLAPGSETKYTFLSGPRRGASPEEVFHRGDPTTVKLGRVEIMPRRPNTKVGIDPQPTINVLFAGPSGYLSVPEIKAILDRVEFVVGRFERFL
jgi:hypothetical protein